MNTTTEKRRKPDSERMSTQAIARITSKQRETWDRLGGADWLRAMLDVLADGASQKRKDPA